MIKIPQSIKNEINKAGKYDELARISNNKIRKWLHENDLYNFGNIDQLVDCVAVGYNHSDEFIKHLESGDCMLGNDEEFEDR